jgi:glycosyltransferase involved in cell wall biosynthesis
MRSDPGTGNALLRDGMGRLYRIESILPHYTFDRLCARTRGPAVDDRTIFVVYGQPRTGAGSDTFRVFREQHPDALYMIGAAIFETDAIPPGWADSLNMMDEVWVCSAFNARSFARGGVRPEKIRVVDIGYGLEIHRYDPGSCGRLPLEGARGLNLLSIFQWSRHKGYDVLFRAYAEAFTSSDDVALHVRTYPSAPDVSFSYDEVRRAFLSFCPDPRHAPELRLIEEKIPDASMPALYNACDAYILPSRGEGWGIPYMEAMALEKIVVATRWGGNLDFMNDANSLLVDVEGLEEIAPDDRDYPAVHRGQRMARPSVSHLREILRRIYEERERLDGLRRRARRDIRTGWTGWHTTARGIRRLREIVAAIEERRKAVERLRASSRRARAGGGIRRAPRAGSARTLRWDGEMLPCSSLAKVNREICRRLAARLGRRFSLLPPEGERREAERLGPLAPHIVSEGHVDVFVRHRWPPEFTRPECGRFVLVQPWEYGSMPRGWLAPMQGVVDRVWVYSRRNRDDYVADGIDPGKISVIPLGIDPGIYRPPGAGRGRGGGRPEDAPFRFLFVGGTIWRKGIDVLLKAYLGAFSPEEGVLLTIKDMGTTTFYRDRNWREKIVERAADPRSPAIEYRAEEVTEEEMARLYRSSDCLVHPYRGEGFGLPVAEAMATGLPVIVTEGGACDDFCPPDEVYRVGSTVREIRYDEPTVRPATVLEPSVASLAETMRRVFEQREEAAERGRRSAERIRAEWTWDRTVRAIEAEIGRTDDGKGDGE